MQSVRGASTPNTNSKSLEHRRPSDGPKLKLNFINFSYLCFALDLCLLFPGGGGEEDWLNKGEDKGVDNEIGSPPFLCLPPLPPMSRWGAVVICFRHTCGGGDYAGIA